jgi:hypothetical protein
LVVKNGSTASVIPVPLSVTAICTY